MSTAQESNSWSRVYNYDPYGNRWVSANHTLSFTTPTAQSQFDAANNRLTKTFDGTPLPADAYDAAGNLSKHPWAGVMAYDANNLQRYYCASAAATCAAANANAEYQYDGDGRRVKKLQGARTTLFVYDAFGNLAAEYDTQPDPNLVAGAYYRTTDHLGSTRLVTDGSGAVVSRRDYFPFAEEIPANTTFGNRHLVTDGSSSTTYNKEFGVHQKFTGKERDVESSLDYFGARYFSPPIGRFTSVDPLNPILELRPQDATDEAEADAVSRFRSHIADPQNWNSYAYVGNRPLAFYDPDGRAAVAAVAYGAFEIGSTAYDISETARTISDPSSTGVDVTLALTGTAIGLATFGPGTPITKGIGIAISRLRLGRQISAISSRVTNILTKNLDNATVNAAVRELSGQVVAINPRTGKPFDHVAKVRQAAQGLKNATTEIKELLNSTDVTKKARAALEKELRQAQKKLDELEHLGLL